jgi:hypothetical protein
MSIQLLQPNGGEVLTVVSVYRITWNSTSNIDQVSIGYKACDSCLGWIANNIPNTGYYDWNVFVGNTTNTQFKIYIIGYDTGVGSISDVSDNDFTVLQPTPSPTHTATPSKAPTVTPTIQSVTPTSTPTGQVVYLSLSSGGTVGGVAASDLDILGFNGTNWSMFFDASDVGILDGTPDVDLNDFYFVDANTILMTFDASFTLGALAVEPWDVLQFDATSLGPNTAGTFSLYMDGSDLLLDDPLNETLDALDVLPDGRILFSTNGNLTLISSTPSARDEDIMAFAPESLGEQTSGILTVYFDGSLFGLGETGEDIDGLDVASHGDLYLSSADPFAVTGVSGEDEDIFVCKPTLAGNAVTSCTYSSALHFDGSAWGLSANDIDGLHIP